MLGITAIAVYVAVKSQELIYINSSVFARVISLHGIKFTQSIALSDLEELFIDGGLDERLPHDKSVPPMLRNMLSLGETLVARSDRKVIRTSGNLEDEEASYIHAYLLHHLAKIPVSRRYDEVG